MILKMPDDTKPFVLECDASDRVIGAILSQEHDEALRPVAFMSHALTDTEKNYEVHDWELLAIIKALEEWRHFLQGMEEPFKIWTDHLNLTYFKTPQKLNYTSSTLDAWTCWIQLCITTSIGSFKSKMLWSYQVASSCI